MWRILDLEMLRKKSEKKETNDSKKTLKYLQKVRKES